MTELLDWLTWWRELVVAAAAPDVVIAVVIVSVSVSVVLHTALRGWR